ncbi:helix-turn-helix domain-containing protein [Glaciibacter superstes]|uniref:helix-turn-helix domain-containing protein n=1 Tax=Glaciibacter superstes TaxID=501023 RepID=UPI0003B6CDFB|nr:helix-turn-helix domain-containing protein [Glaciibacter superstes]
MAERTAFDYRHREPTGRLRRYVESIWYANGLSDFGSERIAPTGSTVLGIVLGDPIVQTPRNGAGESYEAERGFVIGPHDEPIVNAPSGVTRCFGIVTTAIGAKAALGFVPAPLRGRVVAASVWPAFETARASLVGSIDVERAIDWIDNRLRVDLNESEPALDRCELALTTLKENPATSTVDIAATLGISHGHLDREFGRVVGIGPRTLGRILRLRRLVESIDVFGTVTWTGLAAELGWFDQAHLIRDFKRFTGVTPTEYLSAQRQGYLHGDAEPGFVPDLSRRRDGQHPDV